MTLNHFPKTIISRKASGRESGIVVNGLSNLVAGVDAEARRTVEAKYADEWNSMGWARRWKLQRVMNSEIQELVDQSMARVSSQAVF